MLRTIIIFLICGSMNSAAGESWGPIDILRWRETPFISGRIATEADVKEGRAAFFLGGDLTTVTTITMELPVCAILHDRDTQTQTPVIVIQAEETPKMKVIGYRPIDGGNGVCTVGELEFLKDPDERFKKKEAEPVGADKEHQSHENGV